MNNGIYELSDDGKTLLDVTDKNISEAVIPDGVTHIGDKAFWFCRALQSIDIPNSVTYIGNCAFYECEALQSIDIPNSVTHIGSLAFWFCEALQSINIPNSVTYIGYEAFSGCRALESIDIPNSVTNIGDRVFSYCEALQSIVIPNSVTHIGDDAFSWCNSLQNIEVEKDNQYFTSIDGVLFSNDLTQIIRYPQAKNGNQYTIPNSVIHIGDSAFEYCSALQSIDIPNSVIHIGDRAFSLCSAFQSIEVAEDNQYFASIDGVLFNKDLTQIIRYPEAKNGNQYVILDSVTHIGNEAFSECGAQSIDIPNSVTHIGDGAFSECIALQSIDIPNSVTYIGDYAFSVCVDLQSIHIRITDIDSCCVKESAFNDIDFDNCILYIPSGTRWAYRHHPVFRNFKNIEIERIK